MILKLIYILIWGWSTITDWYDEEAKIRHTNWWGVLIACDVWLVIYGVISLFSEVAISPILFILAIFKLIMLVLETFA